MKNGDADLGSMPISACVTYLFFFKINTLKELIK